MERLAGGPLPTSGEIKVQYVCQDCGHDYDGAHQARMEQYVGRRGERLCPECKGKRLRLWELYQAEIHERGLAYDRGLWQAQQVPEKFENASFATFDAKGNAKTVKSLREWAEGFPVTERPKGYSSLIVCSQENGVGKTHLAVAMLKVIINRFGDRGWEHCPYQFWTVARVRSRLYDAQRFSTKETLQEAYRDFATMRLLILDDVGKERMSQADQVYEMYYTIINERYNLSLPVVITSNLGLEPWEPGGMCLSDIIGKSGVSRLREMCRGVDYVIEGKDRR